MPPDDLFRAPPPVRTAFWPAPKRLGPSASMRRPRSENSSGLPPPLKLLRPDRLSTGLLAPRGSRQSPDRSRFRTEHFRREN